MSGNSTREVNPYQAPAVTATYTPSGAVDRKLIKKFRQEILALGAFWIIIGAAAIGLTVFILSSAEGFRFLLATDNTVLVALVGAMGGIRIIPAVLLLFVVLQAHRVLGWAKQIQAAGLPLTIRPEEVTTEPATVRQPPVRSVPRP